MIAPAAPLPVHFFRSAITCVGVLVTCLQNALRSELLMSATAESSVTGFGARSGFLVGFGSALLDAVGAVVGVGLRVVSGIGVGRFVEAGVAAGIDEEHPAASTTVEKVMARRVPTLKRERTRRF